MPGAEWNAELPLSIWFSEGPRRCRSNLATGPRAHKQGCGVGSDCKAQLHLLLSIGEFGQGDFLVPPGNKPLEEFFVSFVVPWI